MLVLILMDTYANLATDESIQKTITALSENGIDALVVESGTQAKEKVLSLLPDGCEVMNMTSVTLDTLGISDAINTSEKYVSVRNKLSLLDSETQKSTKNKLGAAPDWVVGSVHAVTEDGKVVIASNTGSQLSAYAYGSQHVIWVVGTQKIVSNLDEAIKRIYEYTFPLENERAKKAYGKGSNVSKLLIVNKEVASSRITIIFVKEKLGF